MFDNLSLYQTFVIQPLIFLGGVFYSTSLLHGIFKTLTEINPIYYMINTVRYSMLGHADVNPAIALPVISIVTIGLVALNYHLFKKGEIWLVILNVVLLVTGWCIFRSR